MIKLIDLLRESIDDKFTLTPEEEEWYKDTESKIKPETLNKIGAKDRIILGTDDTIDLNRKLPPLRIDMKPIGLWYGIGKSWIDFVQSNMPERETEHVFKIDIDPINVLIIDNDKKFLDFSNQYKDPENEGRFGNWKIDWPEVAKKYKGIEFPIYFSKYRSDSEHQWYYPWDVESGCIWDLSAVKKVIKLQ
jgi:hypothetical protein